MSLVDARKQVVSIIEELLICSRMFKMLVYDVDHNKIVKNFNGEIDRTYYINAASEALERERNA